MTPADIIYETIGPGGRRKCIKVGCGDICGIEEDVDIVVCSAARDCYHPTPGTLIEGLLRRKGISVYDLAREPELNLRTLGGWISQPLHGNFRRIACVELVDWRNREDFAYQRSVILATAFTTLRYLLEQTANRGIPLRRVVLPLLGSGRQHIEPSYLVVPLMKECLTALQSIDTLEEIVFYDMNAERVAMLRQAAQKLTAPAASAAQIFISYNSRDLSRAQLVKSSLKEQGLSCWMAPDSIPVGSSYLEEIPSALNQASAVALVLTPEAEISNWVYKEIGTAISRSCPVYPIQLCDYDVGQTFRFLLEGCQIFKNWDDLEPLRYQRYAKMVADKICP